MILVVLGCLLAAAAQASTGYRIAGMVVNAATGQPVSGARVTVAPLEHRDERLGFVTGSDGRFAFLGMARGKYELMGQQRGLMTATYQQHGTLTTAVVAGPGQDTANLILQLSPPAVISGRVVDDSGDPVQRATAELLASTIVDGRRRLTSLGSRQTDDTGAFRFASLPPGSYYLAVSGYPWYSKLSQLFGDIPSRGITRVGYGIKFYPNAGEPGGAEPLVLHAGQELTANFTLLPVPAAAVRAHTVGGESLTKEFVLTTAGVAGNSVTVRQGTESGELYNFWGVPAGHYTVHVHAFDAGGAMYGSADLDVSSTDTDVEVTLAQAPSLNGTIEVEGGGASAGGISAVLWDAASGRSQVLAAGPDGRFSLPSLPPQRYRVSLAAGLDYQLKRWSVDGARREGDVLDVRPGSAVRLHLVAGKGSGHLSGVVTRDGRPLSGVMVVLAPGHAVQTDSDGTYDFRVPPGDYAIFVVEDGSDLEYANPAALQPYLASAQKVKVSAGRSEVKDIALPPSFPSQ